MKIFSTILFVFAIAFMSAGIANGMIFLTVIGGFCAGVYNAIIQQNNDD